MRVETAPNPITGPELTPAQFSARVLSPTGDINKQYNLGTWIKPATDKDLTNDGQPETIYTFSSGQTLFAVTNYGETKTTYPTKTENKTERTWVEGSPAIYGTEEYDEQYISSYKTVKKRVNCHKVTARESALSGGDLPAGQVICDEIETQEPVYSTKKSTRRALITPETQGYYETKTVPTTVTDYTHPIISPAANWADIDRDGNTAEQVIGAIVLKDDPATRDVEVYDVPKYTLVLEAKPAPPPPPPPVEVKKSSSSALPKQ